MPQNLLLARTSVFTGGLVVTDNFNRADAVTLGSNWTDYNDAYEIKSNIATQPVSATHTTSTWTADTFSNDQYAQIKVTQEGTNGGIGPCVRLTASNNYYYAYVSNNSWQLWKNVSGTTTQLGSTATTTLASGDIIYLEANGTTITLKKGGSGGTTEVSATDSAHTTGEPGINGYWTSPTRHEVDDFEAGDL